MNCSCNSCSCCRLVFVFPVILARGCESEERVWPKMSGNNNFFLFQLGKTNWFWLKIDDFIQLFFVHSSLNIYQIHQTFCAPASIEIVIRNVPIYLPKIVMEHGPIAIYRLDVNIAAKMAFHTNATWFKIKRDLQKPQPAYYTQTPQYAHLACESGRITSIKLNIATVHL